MMGDLYKLRTRENRKGYSQHTGKHTRHNQETALIITSTKRTIQGLFTMTNTGLYNIHALARRAGKRRSRRHHIVLRAAYYNHSLGVLSVFLLYIT